MKLDFNPHSDNFLVTVSTSVQIVEHLMSTVYP